MDLSHFVGQEAIKRQLTALIDVAKSRRDTLPHILLCGPPGIGKRTLARAIVVDLKVNWKATNSLVIERPGDLAALLTNLEEGDILFIREIELIRTVLLEVFLHSLRDFQIDIMIGKGRSQRLVKLDLKRFTLIGTTSKPSQVDKRLSRLTIVYDFAAYNVDETAQIIELKLKE